MNEWHFTAFCIPAFLLAAGWTWTVLQQLGIDAFQPGSLTSWRYEQGLEADILLFGLQDSPRLAGLLLPLGDLVAPKVGTPLRWLPTTTMGPLWPLEVLLSLAFPQWRLLVQFQACAHDSFWWLLALGNATLVHLSTERDALMSLRRRSHARGTVIMEYFGYNACCVLLAVLLWGIWAVYPGAAVKLTDVLLRITCAFYAVDAGTKPLRLLKASRGNPVDPDTWAAAAYTLLILRLLARSESVVTDAVVLALIAGPGALAVLHVQVLVPNDACGDWIVVDRKRLLESSIEGLQELSPLALRSGLPCILYQRADGVGYEDGVDAGGLARDWLNCVAAEAFAPARGLVETSVVDGTAYARLRPGASIPQLEVVGKILGLALRAKQPLGVDVCGPLAHLLAHPELPRALAAIAQAGSWQWRGQRLHAATELRELGFSRSWLRWVCCEEYNYLEGLLLAQDDARTRALGLETEDGTAVTLRNLHDYMRRRALGALVLSVRKELEACWRGLRSIPGAPLPTLSKETLASRQESAEEEVPKGRKRLRGKGPELRPVKRARVASAPSPLQALIAGDRDVPVAAWISMTAYDYGAEKVWHRGTWKPTLRAKHTLEWFWSYVVRLSAEGRADLLEWITSYRRLPPGGFPPPLRRMTICVVPFSERLPVAHTCGLQLDLPAGYASEAIFTAKLATASSQRSFLLA